MSAGSSSDRPAPRRKPASGHADPANAELERRAERTASAEQRAGQLRALVMQLTRTEQRERRRLARILHDSLQQLLVGARLRIQRVKNIADNDETLAAAAEVDDLLSEALGVSRSLMADLYPSVLYNVGLAAALEWLGEQTMATCQLAVVVEADPQAATDDDDLAALLFDATRELLFNVVKHTDATLARITLRREGEEIRIKVRDNGTGFSSRHAADKEPSGTGLGLFGIRECLAMMDGRLRIDSTPDEGTTVTLAVPATAAVPEGPIRPAPAAETPGATPAVAPHPKAGSAVCVLLVDDHQVMLDGLDALLSDEDDMTVVGRATDGPGAIDLAASTHPDVIVMDINLPGMDGIEATRRILAAQPSVKVIALSMRNEEGVVARMREVGAAAYLSKDGLGDTLVNTIRAVAAGKPPL
ncbi:MAG: response regulator [Planctomycetota bacterium]